MAFSRRAGWPEVCGIWAFALMLGRYGPGRNDDPLWVSGLLGIDGDRHFGRRYRIIKTMGIDMGKSKYTRDFPRKSPLRPA
jgi:hypothetical protein